MTSFAVGGGRPKSRKEPCRPNDSGVLRVCRNRDQCPVLGLGLRAWVAFSAIPAGDKSQYGTVDHYGQEQPEELEGADIGV